MLGLQRYARFDAYDDDEYAQKLYPFRGDDCLTCGHLVQLCTHLLGKDASASFLFGVLVAPLQDLLSILYLYLTW